MDGLLDLTKKRKWLFLSIAVNLGLLGFFKYYNFVNNSLGNPFAMNNFLLPVGISFYTFQTLSYTIDVYRGRLKPERHVGKFALYVSFFPQLVAGPIERAKHLLPQLQLMSNIRFDNLVSGLQRIVIGLFKKVVIADRAAVLVDTIFSKPDIFSGPQLLIGTLFFGIQIYGDFSGYSDIAIGTAKIFGIDLMENFKRPYLSRSIGEFWSRWHISLSTWFQDYVYIPLGGNRRKPFRVNINILITFVISGLWHGADWVFVIWGAYYGALLIIEKKLKATFASLYASKKLWVNFIRWFVTMILVFLGWIFFRANSISDIFIILKNLGTGYNSFNPVIDFQGLGLNKTFFIWTGILIMGMGTFHYLDRSNKFYNWLEQYRLIRWSVYLTLIFTTILMGVSSGESQFIYFQF